MYVPRHLQMSLVPFQGQLIPLGVAKHRVTEVRLASPTHALHGVEGRLLTVLGHSVLISRMDGLNETRGC